jgi:hypothetical protein
MDAVKKSGCEEYAVQRASVAPGQWTGRSSAMLLCFLVVSTVVIVRGVHTRAFSYNADETTPGVVMSNPIAQVKPASKQLRCSRRNLFGSPKSTAIVFQ